MLRFTVPLVTLSLALLGCEPGEVGSECTDRRDCDEDQSCILGQGDQAFCMFDCDPAATRLCEGGEVCTARESGVLGVCYLGGDTGLGQACASNLECVRGGVCVTYMESTRCYAACRLGEEQCGAGERCVLLEGSDRDGFCDADD